MRIVNKSIDKLKPYENNPRKNDEAVPAVMASIQEFGFKVPIVIDKDDVIVCGHTRLKAAIKLGMQTVPCIVADDLTPEQIKAFRLADNKAAEIAEWDIERMVDELKDISEIDMSEFGFDVSAFEEEDPEIQEDDFDEEVPDNTVPGDVYELGDHRLICGDSTDPDVWSKLMGDELADFVFTDPPYGVAIGDKNEALNTVQKAGQCTKNIANDTLGPEELYDVLLHAFINVREHCAEDACYFVTSPQGGSLGLMMMMMMKDAGLEVRHVLMWRKNTATFSLGLLDYDYQHEPIFYTWTKSHHNFRGGQCRTTIWDFDKPRKCDLHPTMKPVELIANAILDGTKKGMIVLDAFGGSGSTLIAAEQTGRRCRMIELDPHYCDVIVARWEKLTGKKAVRHGAETLEKFD